jgi:hypothetical protein
LEFLTGSVRSQSPKNSSGRGYIPVERENTQWIKPNEQHVLRNVGAIKRTCRQNTEKYILKKLVLYLSIAGKFLLLVELLADENRSAVMKSAPVSFCTIRNALGFNQAIHLTSRSGYSTAVLCATEPKLYTVTSVNGKPPLITKLPINTFNTNSIVKSLFAVTQQGPQGTQLTPTPQI